MTRSTFFIPQTTFKNNNTNPINLWQEMIVSSTPSQSKIKSIHKNNVDTIYQHDSSVLPSNHESTINTNTNNNNSILWNRATNSGVWTK